jgi:hypothetical protein
MGFFSFIAPEDLFCASDKLNTQTVHQKIGAAGMLRIIDLICHTVVALLVTFLHSNFVTNVLRIAAS